MSTTTTADARPEPLRRHYKTGAREATRKSSVHRDALNQKTQTNRRRRHTETCTTHRARYGAPGHGAARPARLGQTGRLCALAAVDVELDRPDDVDLELRTKGGGSQAGGLAQRGMGDGERERKRDGPLSFSRRPRRRGRAWWSDACMSGPKSAARSARAREREKERGGVTRNTDHARAAAVHAERVRERDGRGVDAVRHQLRVLADRPAAVEPGINIT